MFDPMNRPTCPRKCGELRIDISKWDRAPFTDVFGSEQTSQVLDDANGRPLRFTSTREKDRKMRAQGFEPVGDRVGGARTTIKSSPAARRRKDTARRGGSHERAQWKPAV